MRERLSNEINSSNFNPILLEKDFLLTDILLYLTKLLPELILKWGFCLSKIYYPYFRLSEDLDFTLPLDTISVNSDTKREKFAHKMEKLIKEFTHTHTYRTTFRVSKV